MLYGQVHKRGVGFLAFRSTILLLLRSTTLPPLSGCPKFMNCPVATELDDQPLELQRLCCVEAWSQLLLELLVVNWVFVDWILCPREAKCSWLLLGISVAGATIGHRAKAREGFGVLCVEKSNVQRVAHTVDTAGCRASVLQRPLRDNISS